MISFLFLQEYNAIFMLPFKMHLEASHNNFFEIGKLTTTKMFFAVVWLNRTSLRLTMQKRPNKYDSAHITWQEIIDLCLRFYFFKYGISLS